MIKHFGLGLYWFQNLPFTIVTATLNYCNPIESKVSFIYLRNKYKTMQNPFACLTFPDIDSLAANVSIFFILPQFKHCAYTIMAFRFSCSVVLCFIFVLIFLKLPFSPTFFTYKKSFHFQHSCSIYTFISLWRFFSPTFPLWHSRTLIDLFPFYSYNRSISFD